MHKNHKQKKNYIKKEREKERKKTDTTHRNLEAQFNFRVSM